MWRTHSIQNAVEGPVGWRTNLLANREQFIRIALGMSEKESLLSILDYH